MTPIQLPAESQRAYDAFKEYCADTKRSIRRCARKLRKSPTIIARWSKRHQWQKRLRELELEDCKRAVKADEKAKLDVAEQRERERLKFQQRALEASKRAIERGLEILRKPAKGSKPADAARLLQVGHSIGVAVLGLDSGAASTHFGLRPVDAPKITITLIDDEESRAQLERENEFFRQNPQIPRPKNGLENVDAVHGTNWSERMLNGESVGQ
jgi:hypothetical protein